MLSRCHSQCQLVMSVFVIVAYLLIDKWSLLDKQTSIFCVLLDQVAIQPGKPGKVREFDIGSGKVGGLRIAALCGFSEWAKM